MAVAEIPERIRWVAARLTVEPAARILEVGCGPGVAAAVIGATLGGGELVGIDRSATAIAKAQARNTALVRAGTVRFECVELARFGAPVDAFDRAFAVNVNVFWTTSAEAECRVLATVVRPRGAVHLVFASPPNGSARDVAPLVAANLERVGFTTDVERVSVPALVCVTGTAATG